MPMPIPVYTGDPSGSLYLAQLIASMRRASAAQYGGPGVVIVRVGQ